MSGARPVVTTLGAKPLSLSVAEMIRNDSWVSERSIAGPISFGFATAEYFRLVEAMSLSLATSLV
jgi:hypothetical protein